MRVLDSSARLTVRKTYLGPENWAAFVAIGDVD